MRAGALKHRIDVKQLNEAIDDFGDTDPSEIDASQWETFITRRASIRPLVGREHMADAQEIATGSHWITFRHGAGVVDQNAGLLRRAAFEIKGVQNVDERGRECRLLCEEILETPDPAPAVLTPDSGAAPDDWAAP